MKPRWMSATRRRVAVAVSRLVRNSSFQTGVQAGDNLVEGSTAEVEHVSTVGAGIGRAVVFDCRPPATRTVYHFDVVGSSREFEKSGGVILKACKLRIFRWGVYKFTCALLPITRWGVLWFHCVGVPARLGLNVISFPNAQVSPPGRKEGE